MSGTNKVAKNSLLYTVSNMITKASTFLLLFIYTNPDFISTEDYGRVNLLTSFANVSILLLNLSLPHATVRFYSEYKNDKEKCRRFFGTIMTFMSVFGVAVVLIMLIFIRPLSGVLFKGVPIFPPVVLVIVTMAFSSLYQMYQSILQARQEGMKSSKNAMGYLVVHSFLNIVFLAFGKGVYIFGFELGGLNGMMLSLLISNIIFAALALIRMKKDGTIEFCIDGKLLASSLKYSLPILPHNLANNMASYISKHFLNAAGMVFENGVYSVSMQFSSIIEIVQSSIHHALRPWFNDKMKLGEDGKKEITSFVSLAFNISATVCLGVALFSQEVVMLLNNNYYDAWKTVPIIATAHAVKFIYFTHTFGILYDIKQSKKMILCSGSAIIVNFTLSYILTSLSLYNMYTAALSFLISRSTSAFVAVVICRRNNIIKHDIKQMVLKVLLVAFFGVLGIVPINVFYVGLENQISVFSAEFFINIAFKLVVFAIGTLCIIGKRRKEVISFVMSFLKKKRKA